MPALLCLYRCFGVYGISYISTSSPPSKSQPGARWARKADERRVKSHLSLSIRLIHDPGPLLPSLSIRAPIRFQSGTRSPTPPSPLLPPQVRASDRWYQGAEVHHDLPLFPGAVALQKMGIKSKLGGRKKRSNGQQTTDIASGHWC